MSKGFLHTAVQKARVEFYKIVKSDSFNSLAVFASGSFFVAVIGGFTGILQARWLEPEIYGEFRKYGILTMYLGFLKILVHDGLVRQYPYLLGKGDQNAAFRVAGSAKWWYGFVTIVAILLFGTLSLTSLYNKDFRAAIGWGAQIPASIGLLYGAYLGVMYRTSSNFKRLSYNNVISTTIGVPLLTFVRFWGYWGLALRSIFNSLSLVWLNQFYLPVKVKAVFNLKTIKELAKISLRFSVPGYLHSTALVASVNALILYFSGERVLGVYTLALSVKTMALTFSKALSQIFHVKITTKYGQTEDVYKCLRYSQKPALLGLSLSFFLAVALYLGITPFISLLVPKFIDSIPVIQILSAMILLHALSLPLLIISSALWYRTWTVMCVTNLLVAITALLILPKTAVNAAVALILGKSAEIFVGYMSLTLNYKLKQKP